MKTNKKMASRCVLSLVSSRLSFLSLLRETIQQNSLQKVLLLSRAAAGQRQTSAFRKNAHLPSISTKFLPCAAGLASTEEKSNESSDRRSKMWSAGGVMCMVGGVLLSSVDKECHQTPSSEMLRGEGGRFARNSRVEKRSGLDRTTGIREWRAKTKLELTTKQPDENEPPTKRKTRASQVRVFLTHEI